MRISPRRSCHLAALAALATLLMNSASANPINDQIAALTEEKRQAVFARMMQREGEKCTNVNRTFFQGSASDRSAFWSISCSGGKDWQIMIKNTAQGDAKIIDCATLKAVGGGKCFVMFNAKR